MTTPTTKPVLLNRAALCPNDTGQFYALEIDLPALESRLRSEFGGLLPPDTMHVAFLPPARDRCATLSIDVSVLAEVPADLVWQVLRRTERDLGVSPSDVRLDFPSRRIDIRIESYAPSPSRRQIVYNLIDFS